MAFHFHCAMSQKAMDLVADLLEDDDENIELWYGEQRFQSQHID